MSIKSKNSAEVTALTKSTFGILKAAGQIRNVARHPMADEPTEACMEALEEAVDYLNRQFMKLKNREWSAEEQSGEGNPMAAMMRALRD